MTQPPDYSQFAGNVTQIPLNPNASLIPYADLQAGGSYGRGLILPDDLIPTLGLTTLFSRTPPSLWRDGHVAGAGDVYVVNQSGGGGTVVKAPYSKGNSYQGQTYNHASTPQDMTGAVHIAVLYAVVLSWSILPANLLASPASTAFSLGLAETASGEGQVFYEGIVQGGSTAANPSPITGSAVVQFIPAWDITAFSGGTIHIMMLGGTAPIAINLDIQAD